MTRAHTYPAPAVSPTKAMNENITAAMLDGENLLTRTNRGGWTATTGAKPLLCTDSCVAVVEAIAVMTLVSQGQLTFGIIYGWILATELPIPKYDVKESDELTCPGH